MIYASEGFVNVGLQLHGRSPGMLFLHFVEREKNPKTWTKREKNSIETNAGLAGRSAVRVQTPESCMHISNTAGLSYYLVAYIHCKAHQEQFSVQCQHEGSTDLNQRTSDF